MRSPRLVAESLRVVPDPIDTMLGPVRIGDARTMQATVEAMRDPVRSEATPPGFLRPHQVDPWRRVMAALAGWRAAVLAEPVGTGKTWIALAVAACWRGRTVIVGPAALAHQWRDAMRRARITAPFHSLEHVSRGVPPPRASLAIIDEAHRLRHPGTRRVGVLAPWLVGVRCLLLTATPIVNRRRDLIDLLSLVVADDALALDGVPSIRELHRCRRPPIGLRRLVVRSLRPGDGVAIRDHGLRTGVAERRRAAGVVAGTDQLTLAGEPAVRRLLETVLLDAGASSDAAWHAALRRYRVLLLHSRDAGGLSRSALRRFLGAATDQLVMWPLFDNLDHAAVMPEADLAVLDELLARPAADQAWIAPMTRLLADGRPTACFCRHRATAAALVRSLGDFTAWVTGESAGIGPHRMPREQVLAAFGPERTRWPCRRRLPVVLVATEVLAEGLDLQGASRVVHVDLPWHATRLEQRTGRVRRAGQQAVSVAVVHRPVPSSIERRLGMHRRIRAKGRVAALWMDRITAPAAATSSPTQETMVGVIRGRPDLEARAWVVLQSGDRRGCIELTIGDAGIAVVDVDNPAWCEPQGHEPLASERAAELACAAARWALARSAEPRRAPRQVALIGRILALARTAAARRDHRSLERLDRLLVVAGAPGPRGLTMVLARLEEMDDGALMAARCVSPQPSAPVTVRQVALALYRSPAAALP